MRTLYRLLLRLYPKSVRDEFGPEMLAVLDAATADSGGLWFLLRELSGLATGALRERIAIPSLRPALLGLALAAVIHWSFYRVVGRLLSRIPMPSPFADAHTRQLELAIMALGPLIFMVALVVVLCRQIQSSVDRTRLRAHR